MNYARRKEIANAIDQIEKLKMTVEFILDDEQEYNENIPENLQDSERCYASTAAIDQLEYAMENLADAVSNLEDIE